MKITYKNTALGFLENPMNFPIYIPEDTVPYLTEAQAQEFGYSIRQAYKGKTNGYKKKIQVITQPFYKAYHVSQSKLKDVVLSEKFEDTGTFIIPWPNHTQTIFYLLRTNGKKDKKEFDYSVIMTVFTKSPKSDSFGLDVFVASGSDDEGNLMEKSVIWKGFVEQNRSVGWWVADLLLLKTFLKYCDVETKVVNHNKKVIHCGDKHFNATKQNVEILDSTYFTTISRTEGFGVRGHFRWQPYGPGLTQKRLQWISDFVKHGYTRKAKILRQDL